MFVNRTCRPNHADWPQMPSDAAIAAEMAREGLGFVQAMRRIQGRQMAQRALRQAQGERRRG